ncbi:MAG TPA: hypothetical protein VEG38_09595 [Acidimicrobiia bacterium]|nr:hypothetical protein [Acidimicrobiia bacterium]
MGQLKRQLVMWGAIATTAAVLPGLALADVVSPEHGGGRHGGGDRHGRDHRHDDAKLSVAGRAISKGTTDSYGLQIRGRSGDQPTAASGMIRFAHRGENVMEGLVGEISCLSKDPAGVVSVTGTIVRSGKRDKTGTGAVSPAEETAFFGEFLSIDESDAAEPAHGRDGRGDRRGRRGDRERRGGGELAGKDFALTIGVAGKPQKFSQPTVGEKGSLAACSGGGAPTAEVTRGGFRVREAGAEEASDSNNNDGKRGKDRDGRRGRRGWFR